MLTRVDGGRHVRVTLNGRDVTSAFAPQPDGTLLGLVSGLRDKPADLVDGCFLDPGQATPTPQPGGLTAAGRSGPCESRYPIAGDTRIAAGQPQDLYALKCALKPLDWRDYPVAFTDEQKAALRQAFPAGVCDYRRPGPLERPPLGTWLDYSFGTDPLRG